MPSGRSWAAKAVEPRPAASEAPPAELAIDAIDANPEQPRRVFEAEQLERLADSIRRHGVLQPVVVEQAGDRYQLVVGERRLRAARAAGRKTIPAVVAEVAPSERLEVALIENVQRQDLNPIEVAEAFQRLLSDHGNTQEQLAGRVGKSRVAVTNALRLLKLPEEERRRHDLSSLTNVVHNAAPCPPEVKRAMIEWWGPVIWELYGGTEAQSATIISGEEWLAHPGSVGRAVTGEMKIVDDDGPPLPRDGQAFGHLMVRGPGVVGAYLKGEGGEILDEEGFFHTGVFHRNVLDRGLLARGVADQGARHVHDQRRALAGVEGNAVEAFHHPAQ